MSTPTIHRISDRQPEFPCWLWHNEKGEQTPFGWVHRMGGYVLATRLIEFGFTHWHPDQPSAPTATPPTEQATEGEHVPQDLRYVLIQAMRDCAIHSLYQHKIDHILKAIAPFCRAPVPAVAQGELDKPKP